MHYLIFLRLVAFFLSLHFKRSSHLCVVCVYVCARVHALIEIQLQLNKQLLTVIDKTTDY